MLPYDTVSTDSYYVKKSVYHVSFDYLNYLKDVGKEHTTTSYDG